MVCDEIHTYFRFKDLFDLRFSRDLWRIDIQPRGRSVVIREARLEGTSSAYEPLRVSS